MSSTTRSKDYQLHISRLWMGVILVLSVSTSFYCGCAFRTFFMEPRQASVITTSNDNIEETKHSAGETDDRSGRVNDMPSLVLDRSKSMPQSTYTEKKYEYEGIKHSHNLHLVRAKGTCSEDEDQCDSDEMEETFTESRYEYETREIDDDEELHPAGYHLVVDIRHVDSSFLDSAQRLANAMVDIVNLSKSTMLSYHCHSLLPTGVSCVGILRQGHLTFHTWPEAGVITFDWFTSSKESLIPIMPIIEKYFAILTPNAGKYVPKEPAVDDYQPKEEDYIPTPKVIWKYVSRGFRPRLASGAWRPLESDTGELCANFGIHYKKEVAAVQSPFQLVEIWDMIRVPELHERSLRTEIETYESLYPEFFSPIRAVFLDGAIQSTNKEDAPYHEALVHPGMFAHPDPVNIAIIGGGEGATLREVLKHKTVKKVKMIEIDEVMVDISKKYLPSWSDCSDIVGSAPSCFDDERSQIKYEDAFAWFINNAIDEVDIKKGQDDSEDDSSSEDEQYTSTEKELFEVIIMDALDPQEFVEFVGRLYNNDNFATSLYESLSDDGILIMQVGISPSHKEPAEEFGNINRSIIMNLMEVVGFKSLHMYEEAHCGFRAPWSFMVACKSEKCRWNWHLNKAAVDLHIIERLRPSKSGAPLLKYFDGATMAGYQLPPKQWETVYCRRNPRPKSCEFAHGFDKKRKNVRIDEFEVKTSSYGEDAGRGVFAKNDLPEGAYTALEKEVRNIYFNHQTTETIEYLLEEINVPDLLRIGNYMYEYGYQTNLMLSYAYYVDTSILTFVNHGCNSTHNVAPFSPIVTELWKNRNLFDPSLDRHFDHMNKCFDVTNQRIKSGQEIFSNYLGFVIEESMRDENFKEIEAMCKGEILGPVRQIELSKMEENTSK